MQKWGLKLRKIFCWCCLFFFFLFYHHHHYYYGLFAGGDYLGSHTSSLTSWQDNKTKQKQNKTKTKQNKNKTKQATEEPNNFNKLVKKSFQTRIYFKRTFDFQFIQFRSSNYRVESLVFIDYSIIVFRLLIIFSVVLFLSLLSFFSFSLVAFCPEGQCCMHLPLPLSLSFSLFLFLSLSLFISPLSSHSISLSLTRVDSDSPNQNQKVLPTVKNTFCCTLRTPNWNYFITLNRLTLRKLCRGFIEPIPSLHRAFNTKCCLDLTLKK